MAELVHRYWHGPPSPLNAWTGEVLRHLGHDVVDWTDDELPAVLLELVDRTAELVIDTDRLRHRANVVRWWMLANHGGWWADYDLIALRPFTELPYPATASHGGLRCTSWLAFPEDHPVPKSMLASIAARDARPGRSRNVSGEGLLQLHCPVDVPLVPLPIDNLGQPEGEPWAVHLYAHATMKRGT